MLWTGHAWGAHLGYVTGSPQGQFPDQAKVWLDQPLWFLFWLQEAPQNNQQRENLGEKKKAYFSQVPEALRGLKRASVDLGFAFIEVGSGGDLLFWGFIFIGEF